MRTKHFKYSILAAIAAIIIPVFAFVNVTPEKGTIPEEKGIVFIEEDWSKALEQAKTTDKLVFLDIYATWCGPCKMLKRHTFSDEKAAKFFNENFINVSVNGEKGVGPELARKFGIRGYPSLIVTNSKGDVVLQTAGYVDPEYLINFAKEALKKKS